MQKPLGEYFATFTAHECSVQTSAIAGFQAGDGDQSEHDEANQEREREGRQQNNNFEHIIKQYLQEIFVIPTDFAWAAQKEIFLFGAPATATTYTRYIARYIHVYMW